MTRDTLSSLLFLRALVELHHVFLLPHFLPPCQANSFIVLNPRGQVPIDCEGSKCVATSLVELTLELDPVQAQRVQEALHHIHAHHHANCHRSEDHEADPDLERKMIRDVS